MDELRDLGVWRSSLRCVEFPVENRHVAVDINGIQQQPMTRVARRGDKPHAVMSHFMTLDNPGKSDLTRSIHKSLLIEHSSEQQRQLLTSARDH